MRFTIALAAVAAVIGSAVAQDSFIYGFNAGATTDTGKAKTQSDFEAEFRAARNLNGAPGTFNTIRLYTNIQAGTTDKPIEAFAAAINTNTSLFLGIWASGTNNINNELKALTDAISEHGSKLIDLIVGLAVGCEDLYRISESGIRNKAGVGNNAANIVRFIKTTRDRLKDTPLSGVRITHVDTWTAWTNTSNKAIIDEVDFISVNIFPFYESEFDNRISNAGALMARSLEATEAVAGGKDVYITETGWAYSGPAFGAAEATVNNAGTYWREVGCALFGKRNVFWYTLRDANPANEVKFAVTNNLSRTPRYDLSCPSSNTTELPPADSSTPTPRPAAGGSSPNAGSTSSISLINSVAMALSVVFAVATWAL